MSAWTAFTCACVRICRRQEISGKEGLKQGRTFATNGPLVEFTLGGKQVGDELKFDSAQSAVPFTVKMRSIVPVDHFEVVCNGGEIGADVET